MPASIAETGIILLKTGDNMSKLKILYSLLFTAVVILSAASIYGTMTVRTIPELKTIQKQETTQPTTEQQTYKADFISISDGLLAYYSTAQNKLYTNRLSITQKPKYETDEQNRTKSVSVRISKQTNGWLNEPPANLSNNAFIEIPLTSTRIKNFDETLDKVHITEYAYRDAFYPCKKSIADYIDNTRNSVLIRISLEYENSTDICPKYIVFDACSVEDKGEGLNFSLHIFNYDHKQTVDRQTADWSKE